MSLCQNDFVYLERIKCSIAQRASSVTILDFLSYDKSEAVRRSLSQNTNLDISTLERLVNGESVAIACSALQNKGISDEQRIYIYNKILNGLLGHPYNRNL